MGGRHDGPSARVDGQPRRVFRCGRVRFSAGVFCVCLEEGGEAGGGGRKEGVIDSWRGGIFTILFFPGFFETTRWIYLGKPANIDEIQCNTTQHNAIQCKTGVRIRMLSVVYQSVLTTPLFY